MDLFEARGKKIEELGAGLIRRALDSSLPRPTEGERLAFLDEEAEWRAGLGLLLDKFKDKQYPDVKIQALKQLLEDPKKPGPNLADMRSKLSQPL
ncbi:MAG TPA: hypothetical protein VGH38_31155 [Bryobacteraceae bacterium]